MSYGVLSPAQQEVVAEHVKGKLVHDMGFGDATLARVLVNLGAREVIGVDKETVFEGLLDKIHHYRCRFEEFVGEAKLIFLSWPINHDNFALLRLVQKAETVIYLGKHTDGTACGWPGLYTHLSSREIHSHLPERKNTLTIYGPARMARPMTGEECGGIFNMGKILSFEDAGAVDVALRGTVLR